MARGFCAVLYRPTHHQPVILRHGGHVIIGIRTWSGLDPPSHVWCVKAPQLSEWSGWVESAMWSCDYTPLLFLHVDTEVIHCAISVKVFHTHYTCTVSSYKLPGVHLTGSAQYFHIWISKNIFMYEYGGEQKRHETKNRLTIIHPVCSAGFIVNKIPFFSLNFSIVLGIVVQLVTGVFFDFPVPLWLRNSAPRRATEDPRSQSSLTEGSLDPSRYLCPVDVWLLQSFKMDLAINMSSSKLFRI